MTKDRSCDEFCGQTKVGDDVSVCRYQNACMYSDISEELTD